MSFRQDLESEYYLNKGIYSDIKINVVGGIEKRQFTCHKIVLASKSEMLERLVDDKNEVDIKDTDPKIFHNLLYYVYTNMIRTIAIDSIPELFRKAHEFGILSFAPDYKREIELDLENVLYDLEYSRKMEDTAREKICQSLIERYTKVVLDRNIVNNVSPETILWLLDHKNLNLDTDYELMEFLARYRDMANASAKFMKIAKRKIRYLNMNKEKLIELNASVSILNDHELLVIKTRMEKFGRNCLMPEGFTKNQSKRSEYRQGAGTSRS